MDTTFQISVNYVLEGAGDFIFRLLDSLDIPVIVADKKLKIKRVTPSLKTLLGIEISDVFGMNIKDILFAEQFLKEDLKEGSYEILLNRRDNSHLKVKITVFFYGDLFLIIQDITDRKKGIGHSVALENKDLLQKLMTTMDQIDVISELSGMINSSLNTATVFRIMISEIRKRIPCERASILLFSAKEHSLQIFTVDTDLNTLLKKGVKAPLNGTSAEWVALNNL